MLGVHQFSVGLFIPPHVAGIGVEYVRPRMNMANNALTGGNPGDELVLDRMTPFGAGNGRVGLEAQSLVAKDGVRPGIDRGSIVGVDNVTAGAAAGAIISS